MNNTVILITNRLKKKYKKYTFLCNSRYISFISSSFVLLWMKAKADKLQTILTFVVVNSGLTLESLETITRKHD